MYRKQRRIPTILALLIIFLGIGGAVYLDRFNQQLTTMAKNLPLPEDVHFSNITDSSFVVSWLTSQSTIGSIIVTEGSTSKNFLDDYDSSDNIPRPRNTHYITVKNFGPDNNLKSNTNYTVKILSGNSKCEEKKLCPVFTQKTANTILSSNNLPPARGKILQNNNQPAVGAIIYLTVGKSATLSGRSDSMGLWAVPLQNLRTMDLLSLVNPTDNDSVQIMVKASPGETATVMTNLNSIRQNQDLPNIILGNSYNFINSGIKRETVANSNILSNILGMQTKETSNNQNNNPSLLFPKSEGDITTDNQPRLRGTGRKNTTIFITVNSAPQTAKITVDQDGNWSWRPPKSLSPGTHHVNIQGYDEKGKLISITRKFIVLKSGESVLGEATDSANLTPTVTVISSPTPSPATSPTPMITITLSPTTTITATPTQPPSPTTVILPTQAENPPRSGNFNPVLFLFASSATLFFLGIKIFTLKA